MAYNLRVRHRRENDNIKVKHKEIWREVLDWI
jgi:hypothetical protein